jgi:hypothetical protein
MIIEERSLSRRDMRIGIIEIIEIIGITERRRTIMDNNKLNLLNINLNIKKSKSTNKKINFRRKITLKIEINLRNMRNMPPSMRKKTNKV